MSGPAQGGGSAEAGGEFGLARRRQAARMGGKLGRRGGALGGASGARAGEPSGGGLATGRGPDGRAAQANEPGETRRSARSRVVKPGFRRWSGRLAPAGGPTWSARSPPGPMGREPGWRAA